MCSVSAVVLPPASAVHPILPMRHTAAIDPFCHNSASFCRWRPAFHPATTNVLCYYLWKQFDVGSGEPAGRRTSRRTGPWPTDGDERPCSRGHGMGGGGLCSTLCTLRRVDGLVAVQRCTQMPVDKKLCTFPARFRCGRAAVVATSQDWMPAGGPAQPRASRASRSLANAKVAKDNVQQLLDVHAARDLPDGAHGGAQLLRRQDVVAFAQPACERHIRQARRPRVRGPPAVSRGVPRSTVPRHASRAAAQACRCCRCRAFVTRAPSPPPSAAPPRVGLYRRSSSAASASMSASKPLPVVLDTAATHAAPHSRRTDAPRTTGGALCHRICQSERTGVLPLRADPHHGPPRRGRGQSRRGRPW